MAMMMATKAVMETGMECLPAGRQVGGGAGVFSDGSLLGDDDGDSMMESEDDPIVEAPELDSFERDVMSAGGFTLRDGGEENLRFTDEGVNSPYRPYDCLTHANFAQILRLLRLTRKEAGILGRCLRYTDKDGNSLNAADVPTDTDHFHDTMRKRTPLGRVWEHANKKYVIIAPRTLIQRILESSGAFEEMLSSQQADGRKEEVAVGDTVSAKVRGISDRPKVVPCRLASVRWRYNSDDDAASEEGRLCAEVRRFLTAREAGLKPRWQERAGSGGAPKTKVWEVSNQGYPMEINHITGRIDVVRAGEQGPSVGSGDRPTYQGKGFVSRWPHGKFKVVEKLRRSKDSPVEALPWRHKGLEGEFFSRWADGVFSNTTGLDVVTLPVSIFSDGFDYNNLGGARFSVNASYFSLVNINVQRCRLSSSWQLFAVGAAGSKWQDELAPGPEILGRMQNGCVARIRRGDKTFREKLREGKFDVIKNQRTAEQIDDVLSRLKEEPSRTKKEKLSTELGVEHTRLEIPFRAHLHLNPISQFPTDIFHQDSLRKYTKRTSLQGVRTRPLAAGKGGGELRYLRDLLRSASEVTYLLRSRKMSDETIGRIKQAQQRKAGIGQ
eukprot:g14071.t1